MNWLWQGLLTNVIWELLILGGGIVLAILRKKKPEWALPALYGVATVALLAIIYFAFTGRAVLSVQTPQTTPENVEANIRNWAETYAWGITEAARPDAYFADMLTINTGNILVMRLKSRDRYLAVQGLLNISPEHQAAFGSLSPEKQLVVDQEVILELAKLNVEMQPVVAGNTPTSIYATKLVPINALTDSAFMSDLDQVANAVIVARAAFLLALSGQGKRVLLGQPQAAR